MAWWVILLIVSIPIVASIGIITFIITTIKAKKIQNDYRHKDIIKAKAIAMEKRGDNYGVLPYYLKEFFNSKIDDLDIENLINTTYLNNSQNVLVIGEKVNFEVATLIQYSDSKIFTTPKSLDILSWNAAVLKFREDFKSPLNFDEETNTYDLIIALNTNDSIENVYQKNFDRLNKNSMLIISLRPEQIKEARSFAKGLKLAEIRYEISAIKQHFLYIVKE
ncbi:BC85_0335 family putative methyltransferase [Mycoplasmopsis opalescens]|uniref:BC85_0335 family putative methyltransferase n=1 Tax=Mycoplasmopsis opalescens TaxID=114886 RepID=UPI0004A6EEDB|nr:hypothetical protein [Mycoplasmopsis opalescens]